MGLIEEFIDLFGVDNTKRNMEDIIKRCEEKQNSDTENKDAWFNLTKFWKKKLLDFDEGFKK